MLLYLAHLLDILIIALFIYSFLLFLRRTRSHLLFWGLGLMIGLYAFARALDLELTLLLLQYFVGASIIIFVIIFNAEIRKYFELLGLISTRQFRVGKLAPKSPSVSEIIQSCIRLAQQKIGALIVIQGSDYLDTHLEGGIPLDGIISEEVILSIFDPHSAGHDGALIVSNNRISKFAVQLPLSTNFSELGKKGTRHSAALGLSERSDAFCIVVSEEKGTISAARSGRLKTYTDNSEFDKDLDTFIQSKYTPNTKPLSVHFVKHNFFLKVAALTSSLLIWLTYQSLTGQL